MKRRFCLLIVLTLSLSIFASGCSLSKDSSVNAAKETVIGVVMAMFDDAWRTVVRNELYEIAEGKAEIEIMSGDNSQDIENKKIDLLINQGVNALIVNLVDKSATAGIIEKAKKADIPVIFFNVEPNPEDLKKWDKAWYVGARAEQSGMMQGQILVDYFKNNPTKDGTIRYVMLKGPAEHQDAILRSQYSIKTMEEAGLKLKLLGEDIASWERAKGQEKMQKFLETHGENIDCVIANNDDMALGAIDALKARGYFNGSKYIPVVGVDATGTAKNAVKEGSLLGTVLNDAENQANALFNLSNVLSKGQAPNKENLGYEVTDNKYVWVEYKMVTKESSENTK